jgi:penicillin-binding protein 1A
VKRFFKLTAWFLGVVILVCLGTGAYFLYVWSSNLPYIGSVKEYRPPVITEVFSRDGQVIGRFWDEKRIVVNLDQVPKHLIQAFVAAEDSRFFEHEGVDFIGIFRALYKNLLAGKIEQGGSTITQQVTKSLLLKNTERTYRRKAREALLSIQLERELSKERILFLYLNQIYLGHGAYGVEAAARTYFNKTAKELSLAESALLAGLPQAPARYSPVSHFDRAKARQKYVLTRMAQEGYITAAEMSDALKTPLDIHDSQEQTFSNAPYFTEYIRRYLLETYGRDLLYRGGLKVYTTLDLEMQHAAKEALQKGLHELDKREGYRGPVRHLAPGEIPAFLENAVRKYAETPPETGSVVEGLVEEVDDEENRVIIRIGDQKVRLPLSGMSWARKPKPDVPYYAVSLKRPSSVLTQGDVVLVRLVQKGPSPFAWDAELWQEPEVQGALYCMEPDTGRVNAMVGGRDFHASQFNRAIQSKRQPGSAFKPIIYAAALDRGMSPSEILIDAPFVSGQDSDEDVWKPRNYKEKFYGPTLFRTALAQSRNVITIKILEKIGVPYVIEYARKMGISADLSPDLSLALGSSGMSLMELTRAYSVFANGGKLVKPIFIDRIVDRSGRVVEENQPQGGEEAVSEQTAFVMTDLLRAVIQEGTGWRVKALKRPAAGKTGTTNDLRDAWFLGYTPGLATGVWVGYDDRRPMGKGETGSRAASPIWLYFMSDILKDHPVLDFQAPEGVVFAKIDTETGLLASPYSKHTVFQAFVEGKEPTKHSPKPQSPKSGRFMEFDMDNSR